MLRKIDARIEAVEESGQNYLLKVKDADPYGLSKGSVYALLLPKTIESRLLEVGRYISYCVDDNEDLRNTHENIILAYSKGRNCVGLPKKQNRFFVIRKKDLGANFNLDEDDFNSTGFPVLPKVLETLLVNLPYLALHVDLVEKALQLLKVTQDKEVLWELFRMENDERDELMECTQSIIPVTLAAGLVMLFHDGADLKNPSDEDLAKMMHYASMVCPDNGYYS